ncbi:Putative HAD-hydrolase YfnB [Planococcus massiliensis]|uniref:Putative HAD-hydrolase YfnB n=1 Tax=Planococcus massiliensis TaxID=1499687 RepID=A0A098EK73_9BACL|nr:YjjG family noncanonical pyrimidine nucleotidase [Planococcus massiliensis]CEG22708.1 Putative HAD-hydrolase YfnB [Planococcus massiliensis]
MKYEVVLFDIDDTLLDFPATEKAALHNTFMDYKMPTGFADYHASYREISSVLWKDLEEGTLTLPELGVERFQRLFAHHEVAVDPQLFSQSYLTHLGNETHLIEGAVELCHSLEGCRLAIITNGFGQVQKMRLQNSPLADLFEHIIVSEETGFQKPQPGIFEYAFGKLEGAEKEKALIVGDSLSSDIRGGNNYGIATCWFNPQHKKNETGIKPTYEIHSLKEVEGIVKGLADE